MGIDFKTHNDLDLQDKHIWIEEDFEVRAMVVPSGLMVVTDRLMVVSVPVMCVKMISMLSWEERENVLISIPMDNEMFWHARSKLRVHLI